VGSFIGISGIIPQYDGVPTLEVGNENFRRPLRHAGRAFALRLLQPFACGLRSLQKVKR